MPHRPHDYYGHDILKAYISVVVSMCPRLTSADMSEAEMYNANMMGADLSAATLQKTKLIQANCDTANFNNAKAVQASAGMAYHAEDIALGYVR